MRVKRVEEIIQLLRDDGRRHREHCALAPSGPAAAQIGESLWWRIGSPVSREIRTAKPANPDRIRNLSGNADIVFRAILVVQAARAAPSRPGRGWPKCRRCGCHDDSTFRRITGRLSHRGPSFELGRGAETRISYTLRARYGPGRSRLPRRRDRYRADRGG